MINPSTSPQARIRAIDALRALAVLPVILFHLRPTWLPGGFLGVDVFFVISGFLITGILLRELTAGNFSFRGFYARRIRRILPALFLMLAIVAAIGFWRHPLAFGDLSKLVRGVILLKANLDIKDMVGDYWGAEAQSQPLLHTWSLAVEEQYYLLFPLFIWVVYKLTAGRALSWTLTLVGLMSLGGYFYFGAKAPDTAFYSTFTRCWELLAGALAATAQWRREQAGADRARPDDRMGVVALLLVAVAYLAPSVVEGVRFWGPPLAVAGATLFLTGIRGQDSAYVWLCRPSLLFVGAISYSLYLWHWPVIVYCGFAYPEPGPNLLRLLGQGVLMLGAAWVSYLLVEERARRWSRAPWIMLACAAAIFLGVREAGKRQEESLRRLYGEQGIRSSVDPKAPVADSVVAGFVGMTLRGGLYVDGEVSADAFGPKYAAIKVVASTTAAERGTIIGGDARAREEVLVWGDSHAMVLAPTIDALARRANLRAVFHIKDGADPLVVGRGAFDARRAKGLQLLSGRPSLCVFVMRYDRRKFEEYEASFAEILRHTRLVFVQQPPVLAIPDVCTVNYFAYLRDTQGRRLDGLLVGDQSRSARRAFEDRLRARFGAQANFVFLRTEERFFEPAGGVRWWDRAGRLHYIDDDHLSEFGCALLEPLLEEQLRR